MNDCNSPLRPHGDRDRIGRTISCLAGGLFGLSMLLLVKRYWGLDHDAALYLGQALLLRWPEIYANDLFFVHGSQASYTLFPRVIARLMDWIPPTELFKGGALLGLVLFAAASWYCLRALLPAIQRYWAWLGVLCLSTGYGSTRLFGYAEPFLTSRSVAEPLCLLGIGLLARRRAAAAIACALVSTVLHPLQTLAALMIVWPWLVMQDRRWLHAAWLAAPAALLGVLGVKPFDGLFRVIDAGWMEEVLQFSGHLFVLKLKSFDYKTLAFDAFVLVLSWRTLRGPFGAWCAAALAGLSLGLISSLVLVDALHLQLPAALQLWRSHWLAHWFAMAAVAALLYRDFKIPDATRGLLLGLVVVLAWVAWTWLWIPAAALYAGWPRLSPKLRPHVLRLLAVLFLSIMLVLLANHVLMEFSAFERTGGRLDLYAIDRRLLIFPLAALGVPILAARLWQRVTPRGRVLLLFAVLPLLATAVFRWDVRHPTTRALESHAFRSDLFGARIPEDAQVLWDGIGLVGPWLTLQRSDYFSPQQVSGVIFNRGTSRDALQRIDRIEPFSRQSLYCRQREGASGDSQCHADDMALRQTCGPGPVKPPDYIVTPIRQPQRPLGSWTVQDPAGGMPITTFYLHRCTDIMEALPEAAPEK